MRLEYRQTHLSIDKFDSIEIPDFVVLTGVNGSGKSHLLQAIEHRHAVVAGLDNARIVLFNYETFKLENENLYNGQQIASEREAAWQFYLNNVRPTAKEFRSRLAGNYELIIQVARNTNTSFWDANTGLSDSYKKEISALFDRHDFRNNNQAIGIFSLIKLLPYSIDEISQDEFVRLYKPFEFKNNFLPYQLGKIIWDYYIKQYENNVNEFQNDKHGKNLPFLSKEDFVAENGRPPWEVVNEILKSFDSLKYQVDSPEGLSCFGNYQLRLKHTERPGLSIDFNNLSSGERVLMALVASVYKSAADKHFPDLLLLDEVDASLHPSMMKNMLDVIERIFVQQGVKVILVTHSPTTLALASESSIFAMNRSGSNRIEKKSKADALSILTQGFATLEQGLKLFDQIAQSKLTIISEGLNTKLIAKALELNKIQDVDVLNGIEGMSGKNQLRIIFQFLAMTQHTNKVLVVWDCDASHGVEEKNNTFAYRMPYNDKNAIAKKGIENSFPSELFSGFTKTLTPSKGTPSIDFDENRKKDFQNLILERSNLSDFENFAGLISKIQQIKTL